MCGLLAAARAPDQSPRAPRSSHSRSLTALVSAGSASRASARQPWHAASAPFWPGYDAPSSSGGRLASLKHACAVAMRSWLGLGLGLGLGLELGLGLGLGLGLAPVEAQVVPLGQG